MPVLNRLLITRMSTAKVLLPAPPDLIGRHQWFGPNGTTIQQKKNLEGIAIKTSGSQDTLGFLTLLPSRR
jgi:hypothetical protein